jgi:hypothetical protein
MKKALAAHIDERASGIRGPLVLVRAQVLP